MYEFICLHMCIYNVCVYAYMYVCINIYIYIYKDGLPAGREALQSAELLHAGGRRRAQLRTISLSLSLYLYTYIYTYRDFDILIFVCKMLWKYRG